jgi:hypothetical protein
VVEILADGTLLADRESISGADSAGQEWVSQRITLTGKPAIVFLPCGRST